MHKSHFGATEIDFLGRTITSHGVKPQRQNVQNFLEKTKFPKSKKALQRYLGFLNYYRNYVPRLSERLAPFHKMLKSDAEKSWYQKNWSNSLGNQQSTRQVLRFSPTTTHSEQTNFAND